MEHPLLKYLAFVKTVETGSFTAAAKSINYAQSSISKMIGDLETDWQVTLLQRSKTGVRLTSAGEQILPLIRTLLNDYDQLSGQINRMNGLETGIVRIGTFSSVAINLLPDIFARLKHDYPGIEYELLLGDYQEVENWIDEGRVDCGFLPMPATSSFETTEVFRDEYMVILPPEHPLAEHASIDIQKLNDQPFLLLEHGSKTEISDLLEYSHVRPNINFTTWEDYSIMAMVEKGMGVSILPGMILQRIPYHLAIRPLSKPFYRRIGLAVKSKKSLTPATEKFMEYLFT